jgi:hypothetical protein
MNRQQGAGSSPQTLPHPEERRPAPRLRQLLLCIAIALAGVIVGALGMRYLGMRHEATQDADERPGSQRDTRARAAPGARPDEAGRSESAGSKLDDKQRVSLTANQIT